jgi:hypothetical protein
VVDVLIVAPIVLALPVVAVVIDVIDVLDVVVVVIFVWEILLSL